MSQSGGQDRTGILRDILVGIAVTVVGGVILAYILRDARFDPGRRESATAERATTTPTAVPTSASAAKESARSTPPVAATQTLTGTTRIREKDGAVMVYVSAGEFWMGSMDEDLDAIPAMCPTCKREWYTNETPQHRVPVDAFWIDRTEVTNAQYRRCVDAGICSPPQEVGSSSRDSYYGNSEFDHYPVVNVLAQQAQEYAQWVGGRLPTEAEWEYACRGSGAYTYPWGSSPPDKSLLNFEHNLGDTVAVGSYPDGESWIGVLDMSGNVWERTQSLLRDYPYDPDDGRENLSTNSSGVLRGGSFNDNSVTVRCMFRGTRSTVNYLLDSTGFRVCVPSQ